MILGKPQTCRSARSIQISHNTFFPFSFVGTVKKGADGGGKEEEEEEAREGKNSSDKLLDRVSEPRVDAQRRIWNSARRIREARGTKKL